MRQIYVTSAVIVSVLPSGEARFQVTSNAFFGPAWSRRPAVDAAIPSFDLQDPDVRLLDLDGDGVTDALRTAAPEHLIDLSGRLGPEVERMPSYSGVGW